MYSTIGFRNTLSLSMPDLLSSGLRSISAPLQNMPTLSVVKDDTTSGPLPPRIPWRILSSATLGTVLTVMLGCSFWKAAMLSPIAFTSLGWLQPCQNVMVTFSVGATVVATGSVDGLGTRAPRGERDGRDGQGDEGMP